MKVTEVTRDDAGQWKRLKLENPRLIVEANDPEAHWQVRAPFGRVDRRLLSHGGRKILVDGEGKPLGEYDTLPRAISRRWATRVDRHIVDLDTGATFRIQIANEEAIVDALGRDFSSMVFATTDDQLWWTTLAAGGGRIWLARIDPPGPATAVPYDLSAELVPSRGVWRSADRLLIATVGDCQVVALGPDGTSACVTVQESPEWDLRGRHLIPLQSAGDRIIDISTGDVIPLQTPCSLTFLGVHQASQNTLYICENGKDFGIYTPENSFLHVELDQIATPIRVRPVAVGMRGQRFLEYAHTPTTKPSQIIVDMTGEVVVVPGELLLSLNARTALLRDGEQFIAVDLETRRAMPFTPPCTVPTIHHVGLDQFVLLCPTVDESLPVKLRFTKDALMVEHQEILDVRRRVVYTVDGIVRTTTDSAIFAGSSNFRHVSHPGPAVHVYPIPE